MPLGDGVRPLRIEIGLNLKPDFCQAFRQGTICLGPREASK